MTWRFVLWLDRDGTIVDDPGYLDDPAALRLLPGAALAVAKLRAAGAFVALVTNQSGIARGYMSRATVERIHEALQALLAREGGGLDAIYLCPHLPPSEAGHAGEAGCDCRKPKDGLVRRALEDWPELQALPAFGIGDKIADMGLARAVGARAILVRTGDGRATESELQSVGVSVDHVADDLGAAADWILWQLARA